MNKERLHLLSQQYLDGEISPGDWEQLKNYLLQSGPHQEFDAAMKMAIERMKYESADPSVLAAVLMKVSEKTNSSTKRKASASIRLLQSKALRYAASVLIIAGAGIYFWNDDNKNSDKEIVTANTPSSKAGDILPAAEKTILTLSNGREIVLDDIREGHINEATNLQKVNGSLSYISADPKEKIEYYTVATKKGGKYQVTLPDGSIVWLNSQSSLRFPTGFSGPERVVELQGEAYFEIAKNPAKKFIVKSERLSTEVLGTHFNVNTYADEKNARITLLEGSIKVNTPKFSVTVKPFEQAEENDGDIIINKKVNIDQVMAWKNGIFNFNGTEISSVMRQLSRWYDIEIVYPKGVPNIKFGGKIQKSLPLSEMLDALSAVGVKFELNGNKLTVLP